MDETPAERVRRIQEHCSQAVRRAEDQLKSADRLLVRAAEAQSYVAEAKCFADEALERVRRRIGRRV
ncbi:hypothetical protein [Dactylosporangium sp. NPDC051541]|uniref:hypothetical protein n=1 Tax=Dactylosporangium sp. NPDC051541 TaxID=3363977 RepID=UPI0037954918